MNSLKHTVYDVHMKHTNRQCAQNAGFDIKRGVKHMPAFFGILLNRGKLKIDGKCTCNVTFRRI